MARSPTRRPPTSSARKPSPTRSATAAGPRAPRPCRSRSPRRTICPTATADALRDERGHAADRQRAGRAGERHRRGRRRVERGPGERPGARHADVCSPMAPSPTRRPPTSSARKLHLHRQRRPAALRVPRRCRSRSPRPTMLPTATADTYATHRGHAAHRQRAGRAGNDSDVDGNALSAVLVSGPGARHADAATGRRVHLHAGRRTSAAPTASPTRSTTARRHLEPAHGVDHGQPRPTTLPAATADAYATTEDTPLTVSAPGVLANDTDVDGDPLTRGPGERPDARHLTLATRTARSPTRRPPNFYGADSFTYTVNDGGGDFESRHRDDRGRLDQRCARGDGRRLRRRTRTRR